MKILKKLLDFNTDRELDKQKFDIEVASLNIIEELLEAHGVHDNKKRTYSKNVYESLVFEVDMAIQSNDKNRYIKPTVYDILDAFGDIMVYAFGEPLKLGYNPIKVLSEVAKEISTRVGTIINGKFVKDKSEKARSLWYIADFSSTKI